MDRLVIVVALGGAFIRLGNFFNSEIVGLPTDTSYGVIFRALGENIPRHPTQLYEAGAYIALFALLVYIYKRGWAKAEGLIFGIFMVWLFGMRIIIEFFKENQSAFEDGMLLNMGQMLSIPFIIAGLFLIFTASKRVYPSKNNKK
jgi:prolipoprotein diacylglyceryl transferase